MTAVLDPVEPGPQIDEQPRGVLDAVRRFDALDAIGMGIANVAGVQPATAPAGAPRLDLDLVKRAGGAVLRSPRKHWLLITFAIALASFSVVVLALLLTGRLGELYEAIYTWYPGRPWTHVMRDRPWIYVALTVPLGAVPYALAPPERWGRAFLTYVIFLIGFLGGHVFW